ncbi:MAG TPA: penicillin-binding protein 2 [Thermoleophilaceae bacterium]|nr:penicillin-binding protein 2 [Thermoleophilaceae bacterium]
MNRQIVQLFALTLVLFGVLIAFTSRWTVFEAASLEDNQLNRRGLIEQQQVPRGLILARDGDTVLAQSDPRGRGKQRTYVRSYPEGETFGHPVGYSSIDIGESGLERSRNDALTGDLNEFGTIFRELQSKEREGDDVVTTLDPAAQQQAMDLLAGNSGSIVALEPSTGRVRVMASTPGYDPNTVNQQSVFRELNLPDTGNRLTNRAVQTNYQPGSTFKVVTAAAALDTGKVTPDSIVDGSSPKTISGVPLANSGGVSYGPITLTTALTNSVNTVFASLGEQVGSQTMVEYMERFGFYRDPQLDYPEDSMLASGIRNADGRLVTSGFDVGRVAIGQGGAEGQVQVTPLQMAQVAGAVANGGKLIRPRLTDRIVGQDGRVEDEIDPATQSQVMKPETAAELTAMMTDVVNEGTGVAAALSDVQVAGKTGTAEVKNETLNQVWFIGFAPVDDPQYAIAVTLEDQPIGTSGGANAAPLAAQVLQTLLGGG